MSVQEISTTGKVAYKGATLEEDGLKVSWYWDISQTEKRVLRFAVTDFPCDDNTVATWGYFKLFKKTDGLEYRQNQQVCYRIAEVETILTSLSYVRDNVAVLLSTVKSDMPVDKMAKFELTDKEDEATVNWFFDVMESPKRKVRVSYIMYVAKDPINSSYIQLKLFTRDSLDGQFTRRFLLNMTYMEFTGLCSQVHGIRNELQKAENAQITGFSVV